MLPLVNDDKRVGLKIYNHLNQKKPWYLRSFSFSMMVLVVTLVWDYPGNKIDIWLYIAYDRYTYWKERNSFQGRYLYFKFLCSLAMSELCSTSFGFFYKKLKCIQRSLGTSPFILSISESDIVFDHICL